MLVSWNPNVAGSTKPGQLHSQRIFDSRPQADVRTFEVKLFEALDVSAVFEALSHLARSHYAYLLIVKAPENPGKSDEDQMDKVVAEAARHGIGVISTSDTKSYETWELHLDARRSDTDPIAIEDFVRNQVDENTRREFINCLNKFNGSTSSAGD